MSTLNPARGPARGVPASRDQSIECLRIVAAFGIVAFHALGSAIAYAGLVAFLMLSPMIDVGSNWQRRRQLRALARGFLLPWAFWMLFYGAYNVLRHRPVLPEPAAVGLLYGTGVHLWFLPFMFGVLILLDRLKATVPAAALFAGSLAALVAMLATFGRWRPIDMALTPPFAQWLHATPPVLAGVVAGLATGSIGRRLVSAAVLLPPLAWLAATGADETYAIGMIATAATAWFGARLVPGAISVEPVSRCMMGVYLTHLFWLDVLGRWSSHHGYRLVLLAFGVALSTVWLARRFLPASRLVLG